MQCLKTYDVLFFKFINIWWLVLWSGAYICACMNGLVMEMDGVQWKV